MASLVEPRISKEDKSSLNFHIKEIRRILSNYPYATGFSTSNTNMARAKGTSVELETWISCLSVEEN